MPTSHKIALLATFAVALIGLRYLTNYLATIGGLPLTIAVIVSALILAGWIEPNRDPPRPPRRER